MSVRPRPVSVVIPSLDDRDLLEKYLPPLLAELEARGVGDEVLVVVDTGNAVLTPWLAKLFPTVICQSRPRTGGFAAALLDGVRQAAHPEVFCMNPDILVHPGFLEPLQEQIDDPKVHSAVPRILLFGKSDQVESLTGIGFVDDIAVIEQIGLEGRAESFAEGVHPVAYAIGGAMLLRREEFLSQGGCDPLFEPFYLEDTDLGLAAWRSGSEVRYVADSVVEHHHRGTIRRRVPEAFVRATIERNRYLLQWKYLWSPALVERQIAALFRVAMDAYLADDRRELTWLALALDDSKPWPRAAPNCRPRTGVSMKSCARRARITARAGFVSGRHLTVG